MLKINENLNKFPSVMIFLCPKIKELNKYRNIWRLCRDDISVVSIVFHKPLIQTMLDFDGAGGGDDDDGDHGNGDGDGDGDHVSKTSHGRTLEPKLVKSHE